jgi:hypothetical protein
MSNVTDIATTYYMYIVCGHMARRDEQRDHQGVHDRYRPADIRAACPVTVPRHRRPRQPPRHQTIAATGHTYQ